VNDNKVFGLSLFLPWYSLSDLSCFYCASEEGVIVTLRRSVLKLLVIREALMTSNRYGGGEAIARRRQRERGEGLPSRSDYANEASPHGET
jgi:hypothetical protein